MSFAELNEYDHQFIKNWLPIEEEILQELKMQNGNLNLFTVPEVTKKRSDSSCRF